MLHFATCQSLFDFAEYLGSVRRSLAPFRLLIHDGFILSVLTTGLTDTPNGGYFHRSGIIPLLPPAKDRQELPHRGLGVGAPGPC